VHSDHGREFHELENRYALAERAKGYLLALDSLGVNVRGAAGASSE
jgi:hypothetical protein